MFLQILREIQSEIQSAPYLMVDETTGLSNHEHVVFIILSGNDKFIISEDLYHAHESIEQQHFIKGVLLRMNFKLQNCWGQCYDGTSNMAGIRSGVAKQISDEESSAVFTYCYNHALNLAVGDMVRNR